VHGVRLFNKLETYSFISVIMYENPYRRKELLERIERKIIGRRREIRAILATLAAGKNILLEGPPGTTKSTILKTIAEESGIPFYIVEGSADLTPQKLVGIFNPSKVIHDSFKPEYFEPGPLVKAMQDGGILYIEEFNRMPEETANTLIRAMEEREITIPRYGVVKANPSFRVICAMNPYDDVGTNRISRAIMDRFCRLRLDYQSREEEIEIVRVRTGVKNMQLIELAVDIARKTREHPALKMGASVRGAIDMVLIVEEMRKIKKGNMTIEDLLDAAILAMSSKIWIADPDIKPEDIIKEIFFNVIRKREFFRKENSREVASPREQFMIKEDNTIFSISTNNEKIEKRINENVGKEIDILIKYADIAPRRVSLELNSNPEVFLIALKSGVQRRDLRILELLARTYEYIKEELRKLALRYAREMILKVAFDAISGVYAGSFSSDNFRWDYDDINIDKTLEKMVDKGSLYLDPEELIVYKRKRAKRCYALIIDRSMSMAGYKIILAALAGAILAYASRGLNDYCVLAFNTDVTFLKRINERIDVHELVNKILSLEAIGYTDIANALREALKELQVAKLYNYSAILITDGEWTAGDNPLKVAPLYRSLHVIAVPSKWRGFAQAIAIRGHGKFILVRNLEEIPKAIIKIIGY